MTRNRIEKAIEVIEYAILHNISVKEASIKCGYADTYIKNIKAVVLEKYENGILDDELFSLFMDAYNKYENNKKNKNKKNIVNNAPLLPSPTNGEKTTHRVNGDEADFEWRGNTNYPFNHIKTLDELLLAADVDLKIWQVRDYSINKWDVTSWKNGDAETIQNFQVKAKLEKNIELHKVEMAAKVFIEMTKNYTPPNIGDFPNTKRVVSEIDLLDKENNLLEVSIFDLHLGKLGWEGETGENFDTKIAAKRFVYSIKTLMYRAQGFNISKILFPIGNDFFNSDNKQNTTSNGTPQDEDLRWQKTFEVGCRLLFDAINLLKQFGVPIEVMVIQGNHDFERSFYAGSVLEAGFRNDPMVIINNGASPRKYYKHGEVLLGFTHGKDEKQDSLPLLMASDKESKPLWSKTTYHEWHLGHVHRKKQIKYTVLDKNKVVDEDLGVTVRYLSSLTGTEEWHHRKGYVGQIKAAEAFVWNDISGLIAHLNSNLIEE